MTDVTLTEFLLSRIAEDEQPAREWDGLDYCPIAHWSPPRVLAECEAKRRIVAEASRYAEARRWALLPLAAVYADHPDYREEWKR